jgi:hypothetical protein
MASQKQIDANRRNAQKSTGPITEAGKAVAKFNALRHGMTAESAVLPYEDHLAYAMLREALLSHYAPANIAEEMLVDVVANSYWRLLRARRVETSTMKLGIQALKQRNGINPAPNSKGRRRPRRLLHRRQRQHAQPGALSRHDRTLLLPSRRNAPQSPERPLA